MLDTLTTYHNVQHMFVVLFNTILLNILV